MWQNCMLSPAVMVSTAAVAWSSWLLYFLSPSCLISMMFSTSTIKAQSYAVKAELWSRTGRISSKSWRLFNSQWDWHPSVFMMIFVSALLQKLRRITVGIQVYYNQPPEKCFVFHVQAQQIINSLVKLVRNFVETLSCGAQHAALQCLTFSEFSNSVGGCGVATVIHSRASTARKRWAAPNMLHLTIHSAPRWKCSHTFSNTGLIFLQCVRVTDIFTYNIYD